MDEKTATDLSGDQTAEYEGNKPRTRAYVILGITAYFLILFLLNYFNILRLYQVLPFLSFLPHQSYTSQVAQNPTSSTPGIHLTDQQKAKNLAIINKLTKTSEFGPFNCPSIKDFCAKGVYKNTIISYTLPKDTPIYAAFTGTAVKIAAARSDISVITLLDDAKKQQAYYFLQPIKSFTTKKVKAGDEITKTSGMPSMYLGSDSLRFKLSQNTQGLWVDRELAKENFL